MYTQKVFIKNVYRAVGIIFMFVGVTFLGVSAFLYSRTNAFNANAVPATGTIRFIGSDTAIVTYQVKGQELMAELDFYSSSMRVGDTLPISYDPENPSRIMTKTGQYIHWIFVGVGGLLLCTGAGVTLYDIRKKAGQKKLLESGLRLNGEIVNIGVNPNISSNHRHPYVLDCRCRTPDGATHIFQSGPIWYNPQGLQPGTYIPVYVDSRNYKRYYVDLSRALPEESI
ncbi:MAG: DUF3592 domain-containing protein [Clostridium sp.]|nr:DUF3592 domain-containing protein [Clostridium sp.]